MSGPGGHGTVSFFFTCLLHVTRNWLQHVSQSRSHSDHQLHVLHFVSSLQNEIGCAYLFQSYCGFNVGQSQHFYYQFE